MISFNFRLRQLTLLSLIILIGILMLKHFYVFLPGVLGAVTLYILSRKFYCRLVEEKHWRPGWTSLLIILGYFFIICLPIYFAFVLLIPKIVSVFNDPVQITLALTTFSNKIQSATGIELYNSESLKNASKKIADILPGFLTGTANFVTNLLLMFFILYYMLLHGRKMEQYLNDFIPLRESNRELLATETIIMIRANGIGIPLLAIIQGLVGMLGFYIFGIKDYGVWGFLAGVTSLIPIVGTGLVWIPLTISLFASGHNWQGIGLVIYSLAILTNVDYVARITILKKIGDVHPIITIIGVIIGLSMFGFLGLVFGPLLVSYFILLTKIYRNEFYAEPITPMHDEKMEESV